ncbi:MAG: hypothetical protein ACRDHF_02945, partial [Tepidiformaceae bacterium]
MSQAAPTEPPRPPSRRLGSRLRSSAGGILIPAAVIGAIASFETARTSGDAQREVFFNIEAPAIMYFIFAASTAIIVGAFVQRLRVWRIGKPQGVFSSFGARLTNMLTMGAGTSRVKNDRFAGVMHWCLYSSFIVLFLVTLTLAIDDYAPLFWGSDDPHWFLEGPVYLGYSLVGDTFGIIGLVGIGLALYRRYVKRPAKLGWDQRNEDALIVGLLGAVLFTGFLVEGLRIGGDEIPAGNEDWSYWSPGGWAVARVLDGFGISE